MIIIVPTQLYTYTHAVTGMELLSLLDAMWDVGDPGKLLRRPLVFP